MKLSTKSISLLLTTLPLWGLTPNQAQAQSITPQLGTNSTGTLVSTPDGNQFNTAFSTLVRYSYSNE